MEPADLKDGGLAGLVESLRVLVGEDGTDPMGDESPEALLAAAHELVERLSEVRRQERVARRALRDDARFLDSIVENIPYMIFVKSAAELRFVRFNSAGERLLGYAREDLLGKNDFDFFPHDEALAFTAKDRQVLDDGVVHDIPEEPIHTGEGERWLHTRKIPIFDDKGRPIFLLGISEDITDVRAARSELAARTEQLALANSQLWGTQQDLRGSRARLQVLVAHVPGCMFTTDDQLRITSAAGAHCVDLGLAKQSVVGCSLLELGLTEPADRDALRDLGPGASLSWELRTEGRVYEVRVEQLEGAQSGLVGLALDVTDRQRLEAERLQSRIQRAQKLESLGLLAGGIAHDFNNLLASILGNASMALMKLPRDSRARPFVTKVEQSAERAADLTRQMLAYSGRGRFVIEPLDLRDVMRDIAGLLKVSISKDAALVFDFPDELPLVEADAAQLRQLVMNLLTNASDALGTDPGTITLAVGTVRADRDYLAGTWLDESLQEGEYAWLEVSDTGCGMDAETRSHMFDPFFTTKETGHGLGLAATLGIVRGHRGGLRVYSEAGRGTAIKVLLPAIDGELSVDDQPEPSPKRQEGLGTVLIVDDDDGVRHIASAVLREAGFDILTAKDGVEGLTVYREHAGKISAVLLDMTMPRMNGEETFRELRRIDKDVRVMLTSGYNEQDATSRFAGKGLAGFIQKPFRARDLMDRMRDLVSDTPLPKR